MAKAQGVSHATVQRIWDAHGLQPHRVEYVYELAESYFHTVDIQEAIDKGRAEKQALDLEFLLGLVL